MADILKNKVQGILTFEVKKVHGCLIDEIALADHPFGYELFLDLEGEWRCHLRLFLDDKNNVRFLNP